MTVQDDVGVWGRPNYQPRRPGTHRKRPGHGVRPGTLSAVLGRTTCHRTVVKRPGRLRRPGRSTASTTDTASRTRVRVPGYPRTRGVPRRRQGVPRRLKRSGTCRLRPERDTRPGTMARVRDGRGVLGRSRAVLGRSVPGRVEASRNGKPVLGRGKSSRDAGQRSQTTRVPIPRFVVTRKWLH